MKQYNGEKAIISLTSWRARINTVCKTLFSLIDQCPGFHIVLVLSEEEFPKKEDELPENLKIFIDNDLIEVLWVYKNYKSFKKVLFTMDKYRDVPVMSADDDCIYTCNYAQELYDNLKNDPISYGYYKYENKTYESHTMVGCATIWPANFFKDFDLDFLNFSKIINRNQDDPFYNELIKAFNLPKIKLIQKCCPCFFHNEYNPLRDIYTKRDYGQTTVDLYKKFLSEYKNREL